MHYPSNLKPFGDSNHRRQGGKGAHVLPAQSGCSLPNLIALDIPADLAYVHLLSRCVCALVETIPHLADPEITLHNLELAIQEIGVNIVKHAYAYKRGRICMTLTVEEQPPRFNIILQDTGQSFDPTQVPEPKLGELQEHGFGLFLVRQLMDEVAYEHGPTGNTWKLGKIFRLQNKSVE